MTSTVLTLEDLLDQIKAAMRIRTSERLLTLIGLIDPLKVSLRARGLNLMGVRLDDTWSVPDSPNTMNSRNTSLFTYFLQFSNPRLSPSDFKILLRTLLEQGMDPNYARSHPRPYLRPLSTLITHCDQHPDYLDCVSLLVSGGASLEEYSSDPYWNPPPLLTSISLLNKPLTEHLIALGASLLGPIHDRSRLLFASLIPLSFLATKIPTDTGSDRIFKAIEMLDFLIDQGLDPLESNAQGHTLLHSAILQDLPIGVIDHLISIGLPMTPAGSPPISALQVAKQSNREALHMHLLGIQKAQEEAFVLNEVTDSLSQKESTPGPNEWPGHAPKRSRL